MQFTGSRIDGCPRVQLFTASRAAGVTGSVLNASGTRRRLIVPHMQSGIYGEGDLQRLSASKAEEALSISAQRHQMCTLLSRTRCDTSPRCRKRCHDSHWCWLGWTVNGPEASKHSIGVWLGIFWSLAWKRMLLVPGRRDAGQTVQRGLQPISRSSARVMPNNK